MFIRVVTGIQRHFPERVLEWVMAVNLVWWGSRLTAPSIQWSNTDAWSFMLSLGPTEETWGWICVAIGTLRLLALIINGTFADTWYSAVSPWVRGVTAGMGAVVWFIVYLSVSAANTSGAGIYQLPLVLDLWCSLHVLFTIGRASKGAARNAGFP